MRFPLPVVEQLGSQTKTKTETQSEVYAAFALRHSKTGRGFASAQDPAFRSGSTILPHYLTSSPSKLHTNGSCASVLRLKAVLNGFSGVAMFGAGTYRK
jgi:hypothetical protein